MPTQAPLLAPEPPWLPELLAALATHECLGTRQLAALAGVAEAELIPVVERLVAERHLRRLEQQSTGAVAFALSPRGAKLLAELTGDEPVPVGRARNAAMVSHELAKTDLACVLQLLDADGALTLLRWETARDALADAVHVARGTKVERIPLVADALAIVDAGAGPTALLIEIDMGTVSLKRMKTKYDGYLSWRRCDGPERRFGTKSLRVLTVASHASRMTRLREAAAEVAGSEAPGFLWFATADVLDVDEPTKLLAPRYWTARSDGGPHALFAAH